MDRPGCRRPRRGHGVGTHGPTDDRAGLGCRGCRPGGGVASGRGVGNPPHPHRRSGARVDARGSTPAHSAGAGRGGNRSLHDRLRGVRPGPGADPGIRFDRQCLGQPRRAIRHGGWLRRGTDHRACRVTAPPSRGDPESVADGRGPHHPDGLVPDHLRGGDHRRRGRRRGLAGGAPPGPAVVGAVHVGAGFGGDRGAVPRRGRSWCGSGRARSGIGSGGGPVVARSGGGARGGDGAAARPARGRARRRGAGGRPPGGRPDRDGDSGAPRCGRVRPRRCPPRRGRRRLPPHHDRDRRAVRFPPGTTGHASLRMGPGRHLVGDGRVRDDAPDRRGDPGTG